MKKIIITMKFKNPQYKITRIKQILSFKNF